MLAATETEDERRLVSGFDVVQARDQGVRDGGAIDFSTERNHAAAWKRALSGLQQV